MGGPADTCWEVKYVDRLNVYLAHTQCCISARPTDVPIVAHRRAHTGWLATLPLDELVSLIALREFGL